MTTLAHGAMSRLVRSRKPSVSIINGVVAGGGFGLAIGTGLAIAAESAKFNLAYSGLAVNRVVPDAELESSAAEIVRQLANGPTLAYGATKRLFHQSFSSTLETQMEYESQSIADLSETADFREAGIREKAYAEV